MTAKLNDVDPQAWLADVLGQIADIPQGRLAELLPWNLSNRICKRPPDRPVCSRRGTRRGLTNKLILPIAGPGKARVLGPSTINAPNIPLIHTSSSQGGQ
jgi:hypothetical protein